LKVLRLLVVTLVLFSLSGSVAWAGELTSQAGINLFMAPDFCGKTLAACEGGLSEQMRQEVAAMAESGKTKDEVINHYVGIYGQQILAAPPKEGFYLTAWLMPIIGLGAGLAAVVVYLQRTKGSGKARSNKQIAKDDESGLYDDEVDEEIKKYL